MLEIVITIGADEALFCAVFGYVNPGDEVILLEPCYNLYEALVRTAGGIPVFVPLRPVSA